MLMRSAAAATLVALATANQYDVLFPKYIVSQIMRLGTGGSL